MRTRRKPPHHFDERRHLLAPIVRVAGSVAVVAILGACAGDAATGEGPEPEELAGDWELSQGTGPDGEIAVSDDARPTLTIDGDDWGGTVCNHYSTTATMSGSEVTMDGVIATEMACLDADIMEVEAAYLDAFPRVTEVDRVGRHLVLRGDDVELLYVEVEPEPDATLTGTTWRLESLVHGDGPDGAVSQAMGDGELHLDDDGTLRATTGCRSLAGPYHLDADLLDLTEVSSDDADCDDATLADQDELITSTLLGGTAIRVTVDGDRLQLRAPSGQGLDYRAEASS